MRWIILGITAVFLIVWIIAGTTNRSSETLTDLRENFEEYNFRVYKKSLLRTVTNLGGMDSLNDVVGDIKEIEIFELSRKHEDYRPSLESDITGNLEKEEYEKLLSVNGPEGTISVFARMDSVRIYSLAGIQTDSVNFRYIELKGKLNLDQLSSLGGGQGILNLFDSFGKQDILQ